MLEFFPSGSVSYVYGRAQLLSQKVGSSARTYLLGDVQNSTRFLTDAGGNTVQSYAYDAFGSLTTETDPQTRYLYTGQQYNASTDLYSPAVGRFLSRDTWAYNFQNPVELNRYVYAAGNPVSWMDPSGMSSLYENVQINYHIANTCVYKRYELSDWTRNKESFLIGRVF